MNQNQSATQILRGRPASRSPRARTASDAPKRHSSPNSPNECLLRPPAPMWTWTRRRRYRDAPILTAPCAPRRRAQGPLRRVETGWTGSRLSLGASERGRCRAAHQTRAAAPKKTDALPPPPPIRWTRPTGPAALPVEGAARQALTLTWRARQVTLQGWRLPIRAAGGGSRLLFARTAAATSPAPSWACDRPFCAFCSNAMRSGYGLAVR